MTPMFQASKQLQAIRKQLKQMDEQYRDGFNNDSVDSSNESDCKTDSQQMSALDSQDKMTGSHKISEETTPIHCTQDQCSNFPSFMSNVSISHVNDFEHVESVLSTLIEDSQDDGQDIMPLSQELRQAITNMEDIEDVNSLIGNVINSVQIDSSYDEDLHCIEKAVACTINSNDVYRSTVKNSSSADVPIARQFISKEEEQVWKKDRIKKDNHNIIERRRRYNINDRIKELATLLPPTTHPAMKLNKGSILKASVEYVKELKKDKEKLVLFETKQKTMEAKYQKMLIRIFQLELKMKLYGLTEDMELAQTKRKKRPRRRLCEIDAMVEDLMKQTLPPKKMSDEKYASPLSGPPVSEIQQNSTTVTKSAKSGLRNFINKKLSFEKSENVEFQCSSNKTSSTLKHEGESGRLNPCIYEGSVENRDRHDTNNDSTLAQTSEIKEHKSSQLIIPEQQHGQECCSARKSSMNAELSLDQCNLLLDLFGSENVAIMQTDDHTGQTSTASSSPSHSDDKINSPVLSPVTLTTNMLEALLRKNDGGNSSSCSSSGSQSLESSTESSTRIK